MPYGQVLVDTVKDSLNNVLAPASAVFRNRIINGAMVIDQRNAGATGTATGYTVDRFSYQASQASKGTWGQNLNSVTPPVSYSKYLGFQSSSAYALTATDFFRFYQPIEGFNIADLNWGTANAKTVTLSFWVYSSLTGTFGGTLENSGETRSYPYTYSIPVANTWTPISIVIAGDTSGTWLTTNGVGVVVGFGLGVGTTYSGTAGSWAGTQYLGATGSTSVVGTSGATFYITGVQLEVGTNATNFDYRPYGTELVLCQRYYQNAYGTIRAYMTNTYSYWVQVPLFATMRATPTVTATSTYEYRANVTSVSASASNGSAVELQTTATATGDGYTTQNLITCSAEL
jgi:hypothetical protein